MERGILAVRPLMLRKDLCRAACCESTTMKFDLIRLGRHKFGVYMEWT